MLIDVPYYSQEDKEAQWAGNDCGIACVYMLVAFHRQEPPDFTIDWLAKKVLPRPSAFAYTSHLVRAGALAGVEMMSSDFRDPALQLNPSNIKNEIDKGRPVIQLIGYGHLTQRLNQKFKGGHYVVVVGYNEFGYFINDPDWYGPRRLEGKSWFVPRIEFEQAILAQPGWFSIPYQGVFYRGYVPLASC